MLGMKSTANDCLRVFSLPPNHVSFVRSDWSSFEQKKAQLQTIHFLLQRQPPAHAARVCVCAIRGWFLSGGAAAGFPTQVERGEFKLGDFITQVPLQWQACADHEV